MKKSHPLLAGIETVRPYALASGDSLYGIEPPAMQIDQFLPVGGIMGMTSYPGVGKTWLAMEVARAISSGELFLGKYRTIRGGVLFIGSDSSLYDYARQWSRMTKRVENAKTVFAPVRFLIQSTFMLEDRDEIRRLIRTHQTFEWGEAVDTPKGPVREQGFHTIIIDTLSRTTRANQNDNTEMEEVFRNIRWLAEATDAAIILLHHNSKKSEFNDGADWRGAMSQIGALDSWVQLVPHKKDKYLVGVQFKKFRGITPEDFAYRMFVSERDNARLEITDEPVTLADRMAFDPVARDVLAHIVKNPGQRASEIRNALLARYEEGVEANGKVFRFASDVRLLSAVNNRLQGLMVKAHITKSRNPDGRSVYHATPEGTAQVQEVTPLPTPPVGRDASEPKPARARKPRKKGKAK